VLLAPTLVLLLVAIGGRYTLDRAGIDWLAWLDLRLVGLGVGLAILAFDARRSRLRAPDVPRPEGWLVATFLFFGYQAASGSWSPPDAQVGGLVVDLLCVALLTLGVYLQARRNPARVARQFLWFFWVAAVVFAIGAFTLSGPGAQGRFAAFGGGPNVFVRIQMLGLIAGLALQAIGRPRGIAWTAPLLVVSGLLSGSRGGLVAGVVVGMAIVLVADRRARRLAFLGVAVTTALTLVAYEFVPSVHALIETRFIGQTVQQGYVSSRPGIWADALHLGFLHPFVGVGIDGFRALVGQSVGVDYPHNYIVAVTAEGGIVGLVLLVTSAALWVGTVRRAHSVSVELVAMLASAGYVAVASLFSGDYYDARLTWCFAAVAAALATAPEPRRTSHPSSPALRAAPPPGEEPALVRSPEATAGAR
jgi:O-antigen ligase